MLDGALRVPQRPVVRVGIDVCTGIAASLHESLSVALSIAVAVAVAVHTAVAVGRFGVRSQVRCRVHFLLLR